jgi:hypothetical protein
VHDSWQGPGIHRSDRDDRYGRSGVHLQRYRSRASIGTIALLAVCAVAVLVPSVLDGIGVTLRVVLGLALVAAGFVVGQAGRQHHSRQADTPHH